MFLSSPRCDPQLPSPSPTPSPTLMPLLLMPLHALHRGPSSPPPPCDPNAPCLLDITSALVGPRLSLHNHVHSLIRSSDLYGASLATRAAVSSRVCPTIFTCNIITASMVGTERYDDVISLFDFFFRSSNIVPNVISNNTLILAHYEVTYIDSVFHVFCKVLDSTPFSPDDIAYRHLTEGLVTAGRIFGLEVSCVVNLGERDPWRRRATKITQLAPMDG